MKFDSVFLIPNDYAENHKKINALRHYCATLSLSRAKEDVLSRLFTYAEDALCKPPQNQSSVIDNVLFAAIQAAFKQLLNAVFKKQAKPTDPARFDSYNEIIKSLPKTDLEFFDSVLQQIGEPQAFISHKFAEKSAVSMFFARGSRFASMVAPSAYNHRELMLTDEARFVKQSSLGYLIATLLYAASLAMQPTFGNQIVNARPGESLIESYFDNMGHSMIRNSLLMIQLSLLLMSACALMFAKEMVGAIKPLRSVATRLTSSAHPEGALDIQSDVQLSAPKQ